MLDEKITLKRHPEELERQLTEVRLESAYYKQIAREAGMRRLRDVHQLSRFIAERKYLERTIRENDLKFSTLTKTTAAGIVIVQGDRVVYVNPAGERISGYLQAECESLDFFDLFAPDNRNGIRTRINKQLDGFALAPWKEIEIITKAGRKRWLSYTTSRIEFEGRPALLASFFDISDRKEIEQRLRESEERYRSLVENINEGIMVTQDQKVVFANPSISKALGYSNEEITTNGDPFEYVHPGDRAMVRERYLLRISGKADPETYPFRLITRDKAVKWIEVTGMRIDWNGRPAVLNCLIDITERVQAEEKRQEMEAQMARAQKVEAIGTLAGGIAHDFNNLMMGIQGCVSLMLDDLDAAHPHHTYLVNIEKQIKSGSRLTSQLLGYARKGRYQLLRLGMNQVVEDVAQTFGRTRKDIRISLRLDPDLRAVKTDKGQIEQVLLNFLVNAADAMPDGGDLILKTGNVTQADMTSTLFKPKPGAYVAVSVTDTGTGMEREILDHIFEPFFTTKEMGRGTGLGLASVFGIVKGHGGYIDVTSCKGWGTTFTVYLPAAGPAVRQAEPLSADGIQNGQGVVLLVEDEETVLQVNARMLRRLGYTVMEAADGAAAVDLFEQNWAGINLVVLDMIMPGMGGAEVFERIKQINPAAKVLISSGCDIKDQAPEILGTGCDGFIQKPYDLEEFSNKIIDIISKSSGNA
ncbi:MAG: PAS domain S-box protein [Desulfobacterales bacterium]